MSPDDFNGLCGSEPMTDPSRTYEEMLTWSREKLWSAFLETQVKMTLPYNLSSFDRINLFKDSPRILDLGCGNGAFMFEVASRFPNCKYVGIDRDPQLIAMARNRPWKEEVSFSCLDYQDFKEKNFDVILCRFVVQHLDNLSDFLAHVGRLLSKNGKLIIIDTRDDLYSSNPRMDALEELFQLRSAQQIQSEGNRKASALLEEIARACGWKITLSEAVVTTFRNWEEVTMFRELFLMLAILMRHDDVSISPERIVQNLDFWMKDKNRIASLGMHHLVIEN